MPKEVVFTFNRFVEHHDKGIKDSLVKIRKPSSFNLNLFPEGASKIKTPLTYSELSIAWEFFDYEEHLEILENLIFKHITNNYIDGHEGSVDEVIFED
jgi:hypothetical protein|tara:strand:- start:42 stop:335 length:294 start_codon:yes stop_codon:yes gene_type:complete